jgi:DNA-binding CsgD family transcriptional regulator
MASPKTTAYPEPDAPDPRTAPALRVLSGAAIGRVFPLTAGEVRAGRDAGAELRLDDRGVSRLHAKFVQTRDGAVCVCDLGSTNGTSVNGVKVDLVRLRDGDTVALGPHVRLRLEYTARPDVAPAPPALTARQIEVTRMVAGGLSSAEIADRLRVSERTITTHLDHIYRRLGIRTRSSLTRYAIESGLVPTRPPG